MKPVDDAEYAALVERFQAVLGGADMMGNPNAIKIEADVVPEAVGEKRSRRRADGDDKNKPTKKGRGLTEWIVVYSLKQHQPKKQRYVYNVTSTRLAQHVQKGLADGLYISSASASMNLWAVILDAKTGYTDQVYNISPAFLNKDWIIEQWGRAYYITAFAGATNESSLIVMSKGTNYSQQSYKISKLFPFKWIKQKWQEGFFVTSIATSGNRWAVLASRTRDYKDQIVELDCSYSPERLRRLRGRGLQVTAVCANQEQAAVVLSVPAGAAVAGVQEIMCSPSFPSSHVKEHWNRHLYVTGLSYGRTHSFEGKALKFMINRPKPEDSSTHTPELNLVLVGEGIHVNDAK